MLTNREVSADSEQLPEDRTVGKNGQYFSYLPPQGNWINLILSNLEFLPNLHSWTGICPAKPKPAHWCCEKGDYAENYRLERDFIKGYQTGRLYTLLTRSSKKTKDRYLYKTHPQVFKKQKEEGIQFKHQEGG